MRRSHSHIHLFGVVVLTAAFLITSPGGAQEEGDTKQKASLDMIQTEMPSSDLSAEQQAEYDSWAPDQQFAYQSWPAETKAYYWSLSSERQALFWQLSDEDKIALTAMTGPEREAAWKTIENASAQDGGEA